MIKLPLYESQILTSTFIKGKKFGIAGLKTGRGKTLSILDALDFYVNGKIKRLAILFCNKSAYDNVWPSDIEEYTDLKYIRFEEALETAKHLGWKYIIENYHIILVKYSRCVGNEVLLQQLCRGRIAVLEECLKGDSIIKTDQGDIPIQVLVESKLDCKVLSYDITGKKQEYKQVLNWYQNRPRYLYRLTTEEGHSLVCTADHSIYSYDSKSYKPLFKLKPGERLLFNQDGFSIRNRLRSVEQYSNELVPTYNIEVADNHNYYANNILVSNCHELKNPQTKRTEACKVATKFAAAKWGMSATVMSQDLEDVWGIFNFFEPSIFGSILDFKSMYCEFEEKKIGYDRVKMKQKVVKEVVGYKNLDNLSRIISQYVFNVEEAEDCELLPDFRYLYYTSSPKEDYIYLKAAQGILSDDQVTNFAARLHDLQRVCDGSMNESKMLAVNYRSTKYLEFLKEIKRIKSLKESVVVYCCHHYTVSMLKNLLVSDLPGVTIYEMHGKKFDTVTNQDCVIITTDAGSQSINMAYCNHVVFYSVPFNLKTFIQTVGRITRKNTTFRKNLHVVMMRNSENIDEYKCKLVEFHSELISKILGVEGNLPKSVESYRSDLIRSMRDMLLWKIRKLK